FHNVLCSKVIQYYFFYFYFQAEDGIRDRNVTGVQTCALPISITDCSSLGARPLTCNKANTSELNSCPIGKPANVIPVSASGLSTVKLGVRFRSFSSIVIWDDAAATSSSNSFSSFDLSSVPILALSTTSPSIN